MITIYPFENLPDENFGGKANSLSTLFKNGFNVPKGFVIPSSEIEKVFISFTQNEDMPSAEKRVFMETCSEHFTPLIENSWSQTKKFFPNNARLAVRSSMNLKGGSVFSCTGQFTTVLNVGDFDEFATAVLECIKSAYNEVALSYSASNQIDPNLIRVNLVIQEMVHPDHAGVCFTSNPLTGNEKEIMIESINGLGENLLKGTATPSSYKVNWYDDLVVELNHIEISSLNISSVNLIVETALKIQKFYGFPVDIEWAIKDGELFILQARPMTSIRFITSNDWTNAELKDGGISAEITTPFMYSLVERILETTMSPYLKSVKLHPNYEPEKWFTQFMLHSYWNLSAVKDGVMKTPGFVERDFDQNLGIKPHYEGDGHVTKRNIKSNFNGIQILLALRKSIKRKLRNAQKELTELEGIITNYRSLNFQELSDEALVSHIQQIIQIDYLRVEGSYFEIIYTNANYATLFRKYLDRKNKSGEINYLNLISGIQHISHLRPSIALWDLSRKIRQSDFRSFYEEKSVGELCSVFKGDETFPFREEFEAIIAKFGDKSEKELQILVPNWRQDPRQAFATLTDFIQKEDSESIQNQTDRQHAVFQTELAKISSSKMRREVTKHRKLIWLKEEYREKSCQMFGIIRTIFYELSERLLNRQVISELDDIFFLNPEQILELFAGKKSYLDLIRKNKIIHSGYRNFDRPNEIWVQQVVPSEQPQNSSNWLDGVACSGTMIEGTAYIAQSTADAEKMPNGMIMVTNYADPGWAVYFSKIAGLITETGGLLSHGAVISREFGIPAVLAVRDALKRIKTGDKLRINGADGTVEIL